MKRVLLLVFSVALFGMMNAAQRSLEEAQQAASMYFTSHSNVLRAPARSAALQHSWTEMTDQGAPAFYVFNRGTDDGFVIVSAESRTRTIIGYSDKGHLDKNTMPVNMRSWMEGYKPLIAHVAALPETPAPVFGAPKRAMMKSYTPVTPLCATTWNQGYPYNLQCPIDSDGDTCVTGCVATAAAQIMKVHNYPTHGTGSSSYEWTRSDGSTQTLSSNYASHTYDWSHMINDYESTSSTATQRNAVALLMRDCGIACQMGYTSHESGASFYNMMHGMINYFGYDQGIRLISLNYMTEEAFVDAMYVDLQAGRPVYFSGRTINDAGHAFVGDGVDADGLVHINWGWGGTSDGYFRVSLMDPEDQGIGGSSGNHAYTEQVAAYTNIKPNANGNKAYFISSENIIVEDTRIAKNETFFFQIDTFYNQSLYELETGYVGFLIYKNGVLVNKVIDTQCPADLGAYYYYYHRYVYPSFSSLAAGEYEIVPIATLNAAGTEYTPVMQKWVGEFRCKMTVTNDSVFLTLPQIEEPDKPEINYVDPTQYAYKRVSGYYEPSSPDENTSWWKIQIETEGWSSETADPSTEALLMLCVYSSEDNSFLGSFINDESETYTCARAYLLSGTQYSYSYVTLGDPELTVIYNTSTHKYQFMYHVTVGKKQYADTLVFGASYVRGRLTSIDPGTGKKTYSKITLDTTAYTAVSPTWAFQELERHEDGWLSPIPYTVGGTLSRLTNTPAQIKQYGNCRLYMSDGATELYSHDTKWLNNTKFTTGNEIEQGGKGVIVGRLSNYGSGSNVTRELTYGYFVQYQAPEGSGVENIETVKTEGTQKVLRDGVIYILRNGEVYTVEGIKVNR